MVSHQGLNVYVLYFSCLADFLHFCPLLICSLLDETNFVVTQWTLLSTFWITTYWRAIPNAQLSSKTPWSGEKFTHMQTSAEWTGWEGIQGWLNGSTKVKTKAPGDEIWGHYILQMRYSHTECPNIYRKSVLHLLKYTSNINLSKCSTDLR